MSKSTKFSITFLAIVLGLGLTFTALAQNNDKCAEIRQECNKILAECSELEAKNREVYDECQKILNQAPEDCGQYFKQGYYTSVPAEPNALIMILLLPPKECDEAAENYGNCNKARLDKYGPLLEDCWKRYNECFSRYQKCLIDLDENIKPQDLDVGEPRILPDSPLYFFKNIAREIRSVFTFNPLAKAELRLKFTNERIIEAKKLAEKNSPALPKALENYQIETDRLKTATEKIKTTTDDPRVDNFVDKFIDYNLKHQILLGKFEKELPPEIYLRIENLKEENAAKFSDIGLKLASPAILQEKIIKTLDAQPGSDFKEFKNLEVLQTIQEKVPDSAKPAIEQAMENSLKRLKENLTALPQEEREGFKNYIENLGGNEVRHLQIIDEFEREEVPETVREELEKTKGIILEKVENKLKEYQQKGLETAQKEYLGYLTIEDLRVVKEAEIIENPPAKLELLREKLAPASVPVKPVEPGACIQVITSAIGPDGMCKEFPTPCEVPGGWKKVDKCPSVSAPSTPSPLTEPPAYINCQKGGTKSHQCSNGVSVSWQCECLNIVPQATAYWVWKCVLEPAKFCSISDVSAQPAITEIEIRHYGSSIQIFWQTNIPTTSYMEYGPTTSYGSRAGGLTGAVGSLDTPGTQFVVEDQHLSIGTSGDSKLRPYTTYHFRITAKDVKGNTFISQDYTFATIPECVAVGTKEVKKYYRCSNGTYVDWCKCTSEGKWDCISSPENACPVPVVQQPTVAPPCKVGEIKQYKCQNGTLIDECKCVAEGKWDCVSYPEKLCPVPPTVVPPTTTEKILKLFSPNGGEKWLIGKTYDITWNSQNVEKVNLELMAFQDNTHYGSLGIDLNVPASFGKYSWTIPPEQHLKEGNNFKVVIRNAETSASGVSDPTTLPEDESDDYFSITE